MFLAIAGLVSGFAARAETIPETEAYDTALQRFKQLAALSRITGDMPRKSDPVAAKVLDILSNVPGILDGWHPSGKDEQKAFSGLCLKADILPMRYRLFGIDKNVSFGVGTLPKVQYDLILEQMKANTLRYQDEIVPLLAFDLQCMGRLVPMTTAEVHDATADQRRKLRLDEQIDVWRSVFTQLLREAVSIATDTSYSLTNRQLIIKAAARCAPAFAEIMSVRERATILQTILTAHPQLDADIRKDFDTVVAAFQNTDCTGLCRHETVEK